MKTWVFVRFENILKKGLARKGQGPYLSAPSNNATRRDAEMQAKLSEFEISQWFEFERSNVRLERSAAVGSGVTSLAASWFQSRLWRFTERESWIATKRKEKLKTWLDDSRQPRLHC